MRLAAAVPALVVVVLANGVRAEGVATRRSPDLAGPRIGFTYIMGTRELLDRFNVDPFITQFGWQFEHRFFEQPRGYSGVNELLLLVGGLDQGVPLPTLSWLIGVRSFGGAEFGAGPVLGVATMLASIRDGNFGFAPDKSLGGVGFAAAAGVTLRAGDVNFPINLALVRSDGGLRLSLLGGFNMQRE